MSVTEVMQKPARMYPPRTFNENSDMPADYRAAVVRLILQTGELGSTTWHRNIMRHTASWVDLAPTLADRVRMAEFYADEMRHGFIMENLLLSLGEAVDVEAIGTSIEGLGLVPSIQTWEQVVVFTTLMDRAGAFQFSDYVDSSYAPLANVAKSMTIDERGHAATGLIHLKELVQSEEGRERAQRELEWVWPTALDMFGTSTGKRQFSYLAWGLRTRTNEELRQEYIAEIRPILESLHLKTADDRANRKFL
jgi:ring-1,2-phenylacetyl-CoA epoxidase subunit PaaA